MAVIQNRSQGSVCPHLPNRKGTVALGPGDNAIDDDVAKALISNPDNELLFEASGPLFVAVQPNAKKPDAKPVAPKIDPEPKSDAKPAGKQGGAPSSKKGRSTKD